MNPNHFPYGLTETDDTLWAVLDLGTAAETEWMAGALCSQIDAEVFFQDSGIPHQAKRICRMCPVRAECLAYALEHNESHGVWGGLSAADRERLHDTGQAAA